MTPGDLEEYRALRATIRERGTARVWIAVAGLAAWSAIALASTVLAGTPAATLPPLLLLAVAFEAVFALHTGVERVGRYIQVFHEGDGSAWEHAAMAYGRAFPGGGLDPLFCTFFWLAALLNLLPALSGQPLAADSWLVVLAHALFAFRIWRARRDAARQRAIDLDRFRRLQNDSATLPTRASSASSAGSAGADASARQR
ncbi:MAG: hypothetical protein AB7Q29_07510 [Vicinamibacterales bacterium]